LPRFGKSGFVLQLATSSWTIVLGELRDPRKAALPIVAALGGMIVPAGIYLLLQSGQPGQSGWGIPVATDIAFVAGFLALLGSRVPPSLKIMLMSLAIADDITAILLIAFFYSTDISFVALGFAAVGFGVTCILNRIGVRQVSIYFLVGAGIWLAFLKSGVHPTVAGVLLGFLTPSRRNSWFSERADQGTRASSCQLGRQHSKAAPSSIGRIGHDRSRRHLAVGTTGDRAPSLGRIPDHATVCACECRCGHRSSQFGKSGCDRRRG
jgi:Na+/H+ antiporter NhaA